MLGVSFGFVAQHGRVGDVTLELWYDRGCDGSMDLGPVAAICRPGRSCDVGGSDLGCEGTLDFQFYEFHRDGAEPLGDPTCGSSIPGGCYSIPPDSPFGLEIFNGEPKGGCFWLFASDNAEGEGGLIKGWLVNLTTEFCSVPVDDASWGSVKTLFRE